MDGRYLDLQLDQHFHGDGDWIVDFYEHGNRSQAPAVQNRIRRY